jgi:site-specific DNA-methyltransferase (adenine-specific)
MMTLGPYELNQIYTGDARELSKSIPDESVDLIFTDPVYQHIGDYLWLSDLAQRILKPSSACLMWQGQQWLEKTVLALAAGPLTYRWLFGWYASNNMQMVGKVGRNLAPLLWYEKGHSNPITAVREVVDAPIMPGGPDHKWSKRPEAISHYLSRFTKPGDVVFDPFTGGGTVPSMCKKLGRDFLAFEIEVDTADKARGRVDRTPIMMAFESAYEQTPLLSS